MAALRPLGQAASMTTASIHCFNGHIACKSPHTCVCDDPLSSIPQDEGLTMACLSNYWYWFHLSNWTPSLATAWCQYSTGCCGLWSTTLCHLPLLLNLSRIMSRRQRQHLHLEWSHHGVLCVYSPWPCILCHLPLHCTFPGISVCCVPYMSTGSLR